MQEDKRSFETRLLFIRDIFSDLHSQDEIMAKCIQHKLDVSYENYVHELKNRTTVLSFADPIKILKTMEEDK